MNIKLKIAAIWIPGFILRKELDIIAKDTIEGLNEVIKRYIPWRMEEIIKQDEVWVGNLEERRVLMANAHNNRVKALIEELGSEEAIKIARKSMFEVGYQLGKNARNRLGVGDDFKDLQHAAKIMYNILGIEFKIENKDGNRIMVINSCVLSKYYTLESCMVLSAADEGVVRGLNENIEMQFKERITDGASKCIACINEVQS